KDVAHPRTWLARRTLFRGTLEPPGDRRQRRRTGQRSRCRAGKGEAIVVTQAEPYVGQVLAPREFTIADGLIADYREGLGVAQRPEPPTMLANSADIGGRLLFSQQRGHLWLRQEWEFHEPIERGATYRVEGRVLDIYPRRERTILLTETVLRSADGAHLISVQRHHQSFLLSQPAAVHLRDPKEKEGART